jgi:predicted DNA-binding helix-hairpin-helix protein
MDRMLTSVELVRKAGFRGYVHLKILPGSDDGQIAAALRLATRVSVNLEAPTAETLARIAPGKSFDADIMDAVRRITRLSAEVGRPRSGFTTQFVVGPGRESDRDLLACALSLRQEHGLTRAYFSAFRPVAGTPLEGCPAEHPMRQHRLYQADRLLSEYGFALADLQFASDGELPRAADPKAAWAVSHPEAFPVDADSAPRQILLRVPGIGPTLADRIVKARATGRVSSPERLRALGLRRSSSLAYLALKRGWSGRQLDLPF